MADILEIIVKLTDRATPQAKELGKTLGQVGKTMTKTGGLMTAGLTLPIVALGVKSVMAASDVSESMNKVQVVFGDAGGEIIKWSENASTSLGMTQNDALQAAGTYGNLFRSMGLGVDTSKDMSKSLVTLAADLASFNNQDPTEVLDKLRAGLTGEAEPLKSLGVNINETTIAAKALSLGLVQADVDMIKVNGATMALEKAQKDAAKAVRIYGENSTQAKDALQKVAEAEQGLQDAMAGSVPELDAAQKAQASYALIMEQTALAQGDFSRTSDGLANSMRIVKAQVGDLFVQFGEFLLPIVTQLVGKVQEGLAWFQALSPEMQKWIMIGLGIVAALGPLLIIVGSLISAIGAIIPVVSAVVGVLSGPLLLVIAAVVGAIALLYLAWTNNWGGIQEKTQAVIDFIKNLINLALIQIKNFWSKNGDDIMFIVNALWEFVKRVFETGKQIVTGIITTLTNVVNAIWSKHGDTITAVWTNVWNLVQSLLQRAQGILSGIIGAIRAAIEGDWRAFGENLRKVWDGIWEGIKEIVSTAKENLKLVVSALVKDLKDLFTKTDWKQVGMDIINGVVRGIEALGSKIKDVLLGFAKSAWEAVKGFFDMSSPSKKFMVLGKNVMKGFIIGLQNEGQGVRNAAVNGATGTRIETTFNINANYPYQSPRNLKTDVQQLNALYGRGRV